MGNDNGDMKLASTRAAKLTPKQERFAQLIALVGRRRQFWSDLENGHRLNCSQRTVITCPVFQATWYPGAYSSGQSTVRWNTALSTTPWYPW